MSHLVVLPGVGVPVDLDHVLVLGPEARAEDGVGDVPINVNGLQAPTLRHHFTQKQ